MRPKFSIVLLMYAKKIPIFFYRHFLSISPTFSLLRKFIDSPWYINLNDHRQCRAKSSFLFKSRQMFKHDTLLLIFLF